MPSKMNPITQKMMIANGETRTTAITFSPSEACGASSPSPSPDSAGFIRTRASV